MIHHSRHQNIPELKKRFPSHPANLREAKQEIFSTAATSYLMLPAVLNSRKLKTHPTCLHLINMFRRRTSKQRHHICIMTAFLFNN
jgi:hypothetical protein